MRKYKKLINKKYICNYIIRFFRGQSFRPSYCLVARLRAVLCHVPVAMSTATATQKIKNEILKIMDVDECISVSEISDR